jgi:hypothetical protein
VRRETGERLIDRVVYDFINQVMESALRRRSDVHAGAFADRLQTFEHLNLTGIILRRLSRSFRHEHLVYVMISQPRTDAESKSFSSLFNLLEIRSNSSS